MTEAKHKITEYETAYRNVFPQEFADFVKGQKAKVDLLGDNKYAEMKGSDFIIRKLGDIPETLYSMLQTRLTSEEFTWFRSKEGGLWFYRTFPQYRETKSV